MVENGVYKMVPNVTKLFLSGKYGKILTEFERVSNQAKQTGVQDTFEILWRAEQYRAKTLPGVPLAPSEILQIAIATHENRS